MRADVVYIADVYEGMSYDIRIGNCCLHFIALYIQSIESRFPNYLLRCNALFFIVSSDKRKTPAAIKARVVSLIQHRCRDQRRRQGDQEAQRAREHRLPLVNRKNSMGWWVREGRSLAGQVLDRGRANGLRAAADNRGQPRSNCKKYLKHKNNDIVPKSIEFCSTILIHIIYK